MKTITSTLFLLFLQFGFAQIVNIPDANFKAKLLAHDPVIDTNSDGEIQVSEAEALDYALNVAEANISDLTGIEAFENINYLYCQSNDLTSIDVSQLVQLQTLTAWSNEIESIDISQNVNLVTLVISNNQLTELDVSQNLALEDIQIGYNQIIDLDVSQNSQLKFITSVSNPHTSLDFSQNPNLEFVSLSSLSNLTNLNFQNGNNEILDMYVHGNLQLECIQIDAEFVDAIPTEWDVQEGITFSENCVLGLEDLIQVDAEMFPNPVKTILNIQSDSIIKTIEISALSGQMLHFSKENGYNVQLNVASIPAGVYIVNLTTEKGEVRKKLIKQ